MSKWDRESHFEFPLSLKMLFTGILGPENNFLKKTILQVVTTDHSSAVHSAFLEEPLYLTD